MTKKDKALNRLLAKPSDFEWDELNAIMTAFGYELKKAGGPGRKFIHPETKATLFMHEPHPAKILKAYQVKEAIRFITQEHKVK